VDVNWANFWVQTGAVILALFALFVAAGAQRAIARERRRQFELQILTQVLTDFEDNLAEFQDLEYNPGLLRRYQRRLQQVHEPLPFWTRAMSADWLEDLFPQELAHQHELSQARFALVKQLEAGPANPQLQAELDRLAGELVANMDLVRQGLRRDLVNELDRAITDRADAVDKWWGWKAG
jgi:hypothetical protein